MSSKAILLFVFPFVLITSLLFNGPFADPSPVAAGVEDETTLWARRYSAEALDRRTGIKCVAEGDLGITFFAGNSANLANNGDKRVFFGSVTQTGRVVQGDGKQFDSAALEAVDCLRPTSDGGFIAWGQGAGFAEFIVKFDADTFSRDTGPRSLAAGEGNIAPRWARSYAENIAADGNYDFVEVLALEDGGFFVAANLWIMYPSGLLIARPVVIRLDSEGNVLWTREYRSNAQYVTVQDAEPTPDGGLLLVGGVDSVGAMPEAFTLKISSDGMMQGMRRFEELDGLTAITPDGYGGYIVAGRASVGDLWLARLAESGGISWQKTVDVSGNGIRRLIVKDDRIVALAGEEAPLTSPAADPSGLLQFDLNGNLQQQLWLHNQGLFVEDLIQLRNGRFLLAGTLKEGSSPGQSFMMVVEEDLALYSCMLATDVTATVRTAGTAAPSFLILYPGIIQTAHQDVAIDASPFVLEPTTLCEGSEPADGDGDGLLDVWETQGYDHDGDGFVDVPIHLWGADPTVPDIFVEVDWMAGRQPDAEALTRAAATFAARGYRLHVDAGPSSIDQTRNEAWGAAAGGQAIPFQENVNSAHLFAIMEAHFDAARVPIFHYAIFANDFPYKGGCPSGVSLINSPIFAVNAMSVSCLFSDAGSEDEQTGTFLHELGHNLGVGHGGGDDIEYKPNYLSVMNYYFQKSGLIVDGTDGCDDACFDYSDTPLPTLDENELYEANGIGPMGTDRFGTKFHCFSRPLGLIFSVDNGNGPVNWNCNLGIDNDPIAANIDGDPDDVHRTLTGHDDWDALDLNAAHCTLRPGAQCRFLVEQAPSAHPVVLSSAATETAGLAHALDELAWNEDRRIPRLSETRLQIDPAHTPQNVGSGATITVQLELFTVDAGDVQEATIMARLPAGFAYVPNSTQGITVDEPAISGNTLSWGTFTIPAASPPQLLQFDLTVATDVGLYGLELDSASANGVRIPALLTIHVGQGTYLPAMQR